MAKSRKTVGKVGATRTKKRGARAGDTSQERLLVKALEVTAPAGRPSSLIDTRVIYCGDCLEQLRKLPGECVDLIYIDPPFNSNRNYEVFWGETKEKRAFEDRHASTQAYIDYMRPRCVELARVLKKTGSFYYHCDWHASHYVKVMLDQIFGESSFQSEIIWKRTSAHSGAKKWAPVHDVLLYYVRDSKARTWNSPRIAYEDAYLDKYYRFDDGDGRLYWRADLCAAGTRKGRSGLPWRGIDPAKKGMHWKFTVEKLDELDEEGRIYWPPKGKMPQYKRYREELKGKLVTDVWDDIDKINPKGSERLGYPTQKPLALLERIINASSNPNDIVLDAFCGCGTALVAAQNLGRQWIGIDISPTACRVMAKRLKDVCKLPENEKLWRIGRGFVVRDLPWSIEKLKAIPPFEFENWAIIALGGIPNKVQVGDMGIDGRIYPVGTKPTDTGKKKTKTGEAGEHMFADDWFPVQVKQSEKAGRPDVDAFAHAMHRDNRFRGFMVAFSFSSDAEAECARIYKQDKRIIKLLTVQEILDEEFVQKM